jgi:hypothetical protein
MKVVYATYVVFVLWLIVAAPYWNTSHRVPSHTLCYENYCHENAYTHNSQPELKTPYLYDSPYLNLMYLLKLTTHREHLSQQLHNEKNKNSKLLHACCCDNYCYKTNILNHSKTYVKQPKNFFPITNIQVGPQLNLWNGYGIGLIRSMDLVKLFQKSYNSFVHCICNRMSTSANAAATPKKLFDQNVDMVDMLVNGQKR